MNALILLSILLSAALGIARGADLAFGRNFVACFFLRRYMLE